MKENLKKFTAFTLALALGLLAAALAPAVHAEDGEESSAEATSVQPREVTTTETTEAEESDITPVAAPSISMKPTSEYVVLSPSNVVEKELTVANNGNTGYSFRLYAQPYTIDDSDDNYNFAFNTTNSHSSIYNWINFQSESGDFTSEVTYRIEPGEEKVITYRVVVPASLPAGGQYAAIFAETINEEAEVSNINGIYTVSRVALLLYGRSNEGLVVDSTISDYQVQSFMTSGKITASSRVQSLGNTDVTATYKLVVRGIFGNELYANTWSYPILPDTTRYVAMTWEDTPAFGLYSVQYAVSTSSQVEDRTTILLILPVWMIIVLILVLTALIVWIIISIKKRKERKSRLIV